MRQPPLLPKRRIQQMGVFITIAFGLLVFRLFMIQIVNGPHYAGQVLPQQTLRMALWQQRGDILDRNGIPFTRAKDSTELIVIPGIVRQDAFTYHLIEQLTGIGQDSVKDNAGHLQSFIRLPILYPNQEIEKSVEEGAYPGLMLNHFTIRYDDNSIARHVVGHLRKSDDAPLSGMEKVFESLLHSGGTAMVQAVIDARQQIIPGLGYTVVEPATLPGDVWLTLDYEVQRILEEALDAYPERYHGGLVIDIRTGEILALASRPHFDQQDPIPPDGEKFSFLAIPLQQYPLGSVFKMVVAAVVLEQEGILEDKRYHCSGGIHIGNNLFPCYATRGGLGDISLREAFAYSCNDTFIRLAMQFGGDVIISMAERLGLGMALPIELDNPAGKLMAGEEYAGPGIANLAIGQGSTLVTPLQIADMVTTIANQGRRKSLSLVKGIRMPTGEWIEAHPEEDLEQVLDPAVANLLASYMGDVTEYGTATRARCEKIGGTAGKTGTPQVYGDPHSNEYGWFAGFFPRESPRYTIVIMSREKGGAGNVAAPVFLDVAMGIWRYENP